MHFDALRLAALREGGGTEETPAAENEGQIIIRAPAHVHSKGGAGLGSMAGHQAGAIKPVRRAGWEWGACFPSSKELRGLGVRAQVRV